MEERLQKILSRSGVASRRRAEDLMLEGRVTVNGETVKSPGTRADATRDDIRVDGVRVRPPREAVYLLLNKPRGVVTTRHDPEGRPTVMSLVPRVPGLFPVGRLDVMTEGLLLLTNDGAFAEQVLHPRYEVARVYHAKVRGVVDPKTLARLRKGLVIDGEHLGLDHVRVLEAHNNSWLEVRLHEGKHHEVRRLLEGVGHPVSKLRRVGIGSLTSHGLEAGAFRHLTPREVHALLQPQTEGPPARPERAGGGRKRVGPPARRKGSPESSRPRPTRSHSPRPGRPRAPKSRPRRSRP